MALLAPSACTSFDYSSLSLTCGIVEVVRNGCSWHMLRAVCSHRQNRCCDWYASIHPHSDQLGKEVRNIPTLTLLVLIQYEYRWTFIIAAICGVTGILVTYFFVPDMTGMHSYYNAERDVPLTGFFSGRYRSCGRRPKVPTISER